MSSRLLPVTHIANTGPIAQGVSQPMAQPIDQTYTHSGGRADDWGAYDHVETAACGSSSVAATLERFGLWATTEGVDDAMRVPLNLGGSLLAGIDCMRSRGLEAEQYNGGSWAELRAALGKGYGVIITLSNESTPHTMVVTGIYKNTSGEEYIQMQDWQGDTSPATMSRRDFENEWSEVMLGGPEGLHTGIHRTYALIAPSGTTLPRPRALWAEMNAASSLTVLDGFQAVITGGAHVAEGDVIGGAARIIGGTIECGVMLPALVVQALGAGLQWLGLEKIGWLVRTLGQLVGALIAPLARFLSFPFRALSDWMYTDNNAVNELRHANVNGNPREQRNWQHFMAMPDSAKRDLLHALGSGIVTQEEREAAQVVRAALAQQPARS